MNVTCYMHVFYYVPLQNTSVDILQTHHFDFLLCLHQDIFHKRDLDGSGGITFEEFVLGMMENSQRRKEWVSHTHFSNLSIRFYKQCIEVLKLVTCYIDGFVLRSLTVVFYHWLNKECFYKKGKNMGLEFVYPTLIWTP